MAYNGSEGSAISRTTARTLMFNYRSSPAYAANNQTEGVLFGRDHIEALLAQPGCLGVRIYFGKDGTASTDPSQLILVGTDVDGNDMTNLIVDIGIPCPHHCSSLTTKV